MNSILVINDDRNFHDVFNVIFPDDYNVIIVENCNDALKVLKENEVNLIFIDQTLDVVNGCNTLTMIKELNNKVPVIIAIEWGKNELINKAIEIGVFDYIEKPYELNKLKMLITQVLKIRNLNNKVDQLRSKLVMKYNSQNIISETQIMQTVYSRINLVTNNDDHLLIFGEKGTGKGLTAKSIHYNGKYRDTAFVSVNCAAMPAQLLENELFGYEFDDDSGELITRKGKIELAEGGTLFLDEICNMTESVQLKLLYFIESGEIVNSKNFVIKAKVRIISTTSEDTDNLIKRNLFSEKLLNKISESSIEMPPLSSRKGDILPLVNHFIEKSNSIFGYKIKGIEPEAIQKLLNYDWPGNVRELENAIQDAVVVSNWDYIKCSYLPVRIVKESTSYSFSRDNEYEGIKAINCSENELVQQYIK